MASPPLFSSSPCVVASSSHHLQLTPLAPTYPYTLSLLPYPKFPLQNSAFDSFYFGIHFQPLSLFGHQPISTLPSLYPGPYCVRPPLPYFDFTLHSPSIPSPPYSFELHLLAFIFNCTSTYYPSAFQISFNFFFNIHVHIHCVDFHSISLTFQSHVYVFISFDFGIFRYSQLHLTKTPSPTTLAHFEFLCDIF